MSDLPWFVPGLLVAIGLSIAIGPRVGRQSSAGTLVGASLVFALGLILSATLTPQSDALNYGIRSGGTCDLTLGGLHSLRVLLRPDDLSENIILFIPLGVTLGLIPRSRGKVILIAAALALPFIIEWAQLVIPVLDRACQASDVITNIAGLVLGLAIAWVGVRVYRD